MKHYPAFSWDPETGSALCILTDNQHTYYGTAKCSPKDSDMMSEKTGCEIAYRRALISALSSHRDELKIEIKALKNYYYTMNHSKYFDENSYPIQRLNAQISMLTDELSEIKNLLKEEKNYLKNYIETKEKLYTHIRANKQANSL